MYQKQQEKVIILIINNDLKDQKVKWWMQGHYVFATMY